MFSRIDTFGAASSSLIVAALAVALLLSTAGPAMCQHSLHGEYESYNAVGLHPWPEAYSARGRFRLIGRYSGQKYMAYAATRFSHSISDPERGGLDGPLRLRLLESFIDIYTKRLDIRIGHQLVVWGQMDGVFVTDVVSPLDLTEFLAQDFTDIRLAVPAIKASYFSGEWSVTGLIVAGPVRSPVPDDSSPWFAVPDVPGVAGVLLGEDNLPDPSIKNVEPGLKLTHAGSITTAELIYFYGRNRIPAFAKEITVSNSGVRVLVEPFYRQRHVIGGRAATIVFDPLVVETEWAYESNVSVDMDPQSLLNATRSAGSEENLLLEVGHLMGGLSAARTYEATLVRIQLLGSLLTRYDGRTARDRFQGAVTVLFQSSWRSDTYTATMFTYLGAGGDYWLNPTLRYNVEGGLNLSLGAHIFGGKKSAGALTTSAFGLFDGNDFVFTRFTMAF